MTRRSSGRPGERERVRALVRALSEDELVDLLCELHLEQYALRQAHLGIVRELARAVAG